MGMRSKMNSFQRALNTARNRDTAKEVYPSKRAVWNAICSGRGCWWRLDCRT